MELFQFLQLTISILVPSILVIGFYVAVKIDVAKLQVLVAELSKDILEIKIDLKELCKPKKQYNETE